MVQKFTILFDLDGTLIDTAPDLILAHNHVMKKFGYPVVFDATHSAQIPGNHENNTGGNREYIPSQTFAAVSAGADGIFMEVHDNVDNALSDASTQWPIEKLENTLQSILAFRKTYLNHG